MHQRDITAATSRRRARVVDHRSRSRTQRTCRSSGDWKAHGGPAVARCNCLARVATSYRKPVQRWPNLAYVQPRRRGSVHRGTCLCLIQLRRDSPVPPILRRGRRRGCGASAGTVTCTRSRWRGPTRLPAVITAPHAPCRRSHRRNCAGRGAPGSPSAAASASRPLCVRPAVFAQVAGPASGVNPLVRRMPGPGRLLWPPRPRPVHDRVGDETHVARSRDPYAP